ncbi:MAG: hypothetical protein V4459_10125 [Pseudomonadota bacterium]
MSRSSKSNASAAGGFLIALGLIGGAVVGAVRGQPSLSLLIGGGLGVALALAVWLVDRRPKN